MHRFLSVLIPILFACLLAPAADEIVLLEARWASVPTTLPLPADLVLPEGRTRWNLSALAPTEPRLQRLLAGPVPSRIERVVQSVEAPEIHATRSTFEDPEATGAAERWLLPHRDPALLDTRGTAPMRLRRDGNEALIRTRRVGMGWLHLPSGPREVVLQSAWVRDAQAAPGDNGLLYHRWIDPRAGLVAQVWGPATPDGRLRTGISGAEIVEGFLLEPEGQKQYIDQVAASTCPDSSEICRARLKYGRARGGKTCSGTTTPCADGSDCAILQECTRPIAGVTAPSYTTMGELIAAGAWDFSPNTAENDLGVNVAASVDMAEDQTCNYGQCGFVDGRQLNREDKIEEISGSLRKTLTVVEQTRPEEGPATVWLRAGARNEGAAGSLGSGESRFCYDPAEGYTAVPLWQFQNQDAQGWYMQLGDSWSSGVFECEQNIFNHVCPSDCDSVTFCRVYVAACDDYSGTQSTSVIAEGPVTMPSGHTFQALVARNVTSMCVYPGSATCSGFFSSRVRTAVFLWQVPYMGTVAKMVSPQDAPADLESFEVVTETDVGFGLYPPVSISVDAVVDDTVQLSWDPGSDAERIVGYKLYWGPVSGAEAPYANERVQPAASGTSATIGGLTLGQEYFFSVTALSEYENGQTGVMTTYESLMYPLSIPTTDGGFIPIEVSATPGCAAALPPVEGLRLNMQGGGDVEFCWDAAAGSCVESYQLLGHTVPEIRDDFGVLVDDTAGATCVTLNDPSQTYYLVRTKSSSGVGPLEPAAP